MIFVGSVALAMLQNLLSVSFMFVAVSVLVAGLGLSHPISTQETKGSYSDGDYLNSVHNSNHSYDCLSKIIL